MAISSYLALKLCEKILEDTDFTVTTPYISLHTATPGTTGANEMTAGAEGGSYARQACTSWDIALPRANAAEILWTNTPYVQVTHIGIWNAVSAGNFLWGGALEVPTTLFLGERFRFQAGRLKVNLGRGWSDYLIPKILDKLLKNADFNVDFVYASIHTGDPGGDGANEVGGAANRPNIAAATWGDPTLSAPTWTAENVLAGNAVWTTMPNNTYTHIGLWDAQPNGTGNFLWGGALTTPVTTTGGNSEISIAANSSFFAKIIQNP